APPVWSPTALLGQLRATAAPAAGLLVWSLGVAAVAGLSCAALGLWACWCARDAPRFRAGLFLLCAVAWAMPGPVLGLGLQGVLSGVVGWPGAAAWLATLIWHGPSYLPVLWVDVVRFLPCAVAVLWPSVRLVPRELVELARLDSGSALAELRHAVWPTAG